MMAAGVVLYGVVKSDSENKVKKFLFFRIQIVKKLLYYCIIHHKQLFKIFWNVIVNDCVTSIKNK